jgi:GAF domain-containing protein
MKIVVPDVAAQDNYIACSFTVKSEIVVPFLLMGKKHWANRYR